MTQPPIARNCPNCGGLNYGGLPGCILCGALMGPAPAASPPASAQIFCGECGCAIEAGVTFCGECGTPVEASTAPVAPPPRAPAPTGPKSEWAPKPPTPTPPPPPASPSAQATQPVRRFCPKCGTPLTPGKWFCKKCGHNVQTGKRTAEPVRPRAVRPEPPKPAPPPAAAPPPAPAGGPRTPGAGTRVLKGVMRGVIPIGSMVVTYYLTNRFAGSALAAQFQGMPPQTVPMVISMAVGGIARQLTK